MAQNQSFSYRRTACKVISFIDMCEKHFFFWPASKEGIFRAYLWLCVCMPLLLQSSRMHIKHYSSSTVVVASGCLKFLLSLLEREKNNHSFTCCSISWLKKTSLITKVVFRSATIKWSPLTNAPFWLLLQQGHSSSRVLTAAKEEGREISIWLF